MSAQENFENKKFDILFQSLADSNRFVDHGIVSFEKQMIDAQDELMKKVAGIKGGYNAALEEKEIELNDNWRFHNATAKVSGRIYLTDDSLVDLVSKKFGEPEEDENGELFFYVEDALMTSHGVEAIPEFDALDESDESHFIVGVKIGYAFADGEDQFDRPIYTAYPGELVKHEYDIVTPEEAEMRLRQYWPKELGHCNALLKSSMKSSIQERIAVLCRLLQDEIKNDEEFAQLFEIYLNKTIAFDAELPYIVTARGGLSTFDGEDLYSEDAPRQWVHLKIKSPLSFLGYEPKLHLSTHTDGIVRGHILFATYNNEDGDEPEYISIDAENITQLRSTRVSQSIAARAVLGYFDNANGSALEQAGAEIADAQLSDKPIAVEHEFGVKRDGGRKTEELKQLRFIKGELESIAKDIRHRQSIVYPALDDAVIASKEVAGKIREMLNDAGVTTAHEFQASGDQVFTPRFISDSEIIEKHPTSVFISFDATKPFQTVSNGDTINGVLDSFQPFVKERKDSEGNVLGYFINPSVLLEPTRGDLKRSVLRWQGASLVDVTVGTKVIVPLDGSAEIKLIALDALESIHSSLTELKLMYGPASSITRQMHRLHRALVSEDASDYVSLRHLSVLRDIGVEVERLAIDRKDTKLVSEVLTNLLLERNIQISGEVYNVLDGKITSKMKFAKNEAVAGTIVDIRDDIWPDRPAIVIHSPGNEVRYAPLDGIDIFRF